MKVTKDPRCPQHPAYSMNVQYKTLEYSSPVWVCAICHRELGFRSLASGLFTGGAPFPHGRRRTPRDAQLSAVDWNFVFRREGPDPAEASPMTADEAEAFMDSLVDTSSKPVMSIEEALGRDRLDRF